MEARARRRDFILNFVSRSTSLISSHSSQSGHMCVCRPIGRISSFENDGLMKFEGRRSPDRTLVLQIKGQGLSHAGSLSLLVQRIQVEANESRLPLSSSVVQRIRREGQAEEVAMVSHRPPAFNARVMGKRGCTRYWPTPESPN
jgi:hypothetical protein